MPKKKKTERIEGWLCRDEDGLVVFYSTGVEYDKECGWWCREGEGMWEWTQEQWEKEYSTKLPKAGERVFVDLEV